MCKLSIIVPVYNMAKDGMLQFCLDSLLAQTLDSYEIIAVNDASTDDSLKVLKEYEVQNPSKVRVLTYTENKRQGGARNEGMKIAKGEWIAFLDSDDWVAPDCYEKMIQRGENTGADCVGCLYQMAYAHAWTQGEAIYDMDIANVGQMDEEKTKRLIRKPGSMVMKIYRKEMIEKHGLCFPEHIFYEDNSAGPVWALYYKNFQLIEEPLYYYYQNPNSTVHKISLQKCEDRMTAMELTYKEYEERGFLETYRQELEYLFIRLYFVNTLFTYMLSDREAGIGFVRKLKKGMISRFPKFLDNPYYDVTDPEENKMIRLLMKNTTAFYLYYTALWFYRKKIRKLIKKGAA